MEDIPRLAIDVLIIIFRAFPGRFVLVGGGALHWVFHSPRMSADIDLKPLSSPDKKALQHVLKALNKKLPSVGISLGKSISCHLDPQGDAVRIQVDGHPALRIELAPLTPVSGKEKHLLQGATLQSEIIITPDIHQLLFAKAVALLKRPHVKGRDVFDIWFLQDREAILDAAAFTDWLTWEELESSDLQEKLKQITPSRLRADLARFLPDSIQKALSEENYKTLIDAAHNLLGPYV